MKVKFNTQGRVKPKVSNWTGNVFWKICNLSKVKDLHLSNKYLLNINKKNIPWDKQNQKLSFIKQMNFYWFDQKLTHDTAAKL